MTFSLLLRSALFSLSGALVLVIAGGCKRKPSLNKIQITLDQPSSHYKQGDPISAYFVTGGKTVSPDALDSVNYYVDEVLQSGQRKNDFSISSQAMSLGQHNLKARLHASGEYKELVIAFQITSAITPTVYTYRVVKEHPHDTAAYTQGLEYHNEHFYESTGLYGHSTMRISNVLTGKVLKQRTLSEKDFGEGLTLLGSKLIQLTWQSGIGYVYDLKLNQIGSFNYGQSKEGWGLCNDGKSLYKSDGSNKIYRLNPETFMEEGFIEVTGPDDVINRINELEYIDGKLYANVYETNYILVIDPKTGAVLGVANMEGLLKPEDIHPNTDVLNGIAYDAKGKRLFVTGKRWPKVFEVELIPKQGGI